METVSWEEVSDYLSAGNLMSMRFEENFTSIYLDIIYGNGDTIQELDLQVACLGCSYVDWRRADQHEEGCGIIYEAYLLQKSPLIDDLLSHKLQGIAGTLPLERKNSIIKHFQIIGEISINVLCEKVEFKAKGLPLEMHA